MKTRKVKRIRDGILFTATRYLLHNPAFVEVDDSGIPVYAGHMEQKAEVAETVKQREGGYPFDSILTKRELVAYGVKTFNVEMKMSMREDEMRAKLAQLHDDTGV